MARDSRGRGRDADGRRRGRLSCAVIRSGAGRRAVAGRRWRRRHGPPQRRDARQDRSANGAGAEARCRDCRRPACTRRAPRALVRLGPRYMAWHAACFAGAPAAIWCFLRPPPDTKSRRRPAQDMPRYHWEPPSPKKRPPKDIRRIGRRRGGGGGGGGGGVRKGACLGAAPGRPRHQAQEEPTTIIYATECRGRAVYMGAGVLRTAPCHVTTILGMRRCTA